MRIRHLLSAAIMLAAVPFLGLASAQLSDPAIAAAPTARPNTTNDNLVRLLGDAVNARERYVKFAEQADKEGYLKVASLFRAAARGAEVHRDNALATLKKEGVKVEAPAPQPVEVKSTKENLQEAIRSSNERSSREYQTYWAKARQEKAADSVRTFNFARQAEKKLGDLLSEAEKNLDSWKTPKTTFIVVNVCGYVTPDLGLKKCPICFSEADTFEKLN
jgi:rubrerythrin